MMLLTGSTPPRNAYYFTGRRLHFVEGDFAGLVQTVGGPFFAIAKGGVAMTVSWHQLRE